MYDKNIHQDMTLAVRNVKSRNQLHLFQLQSNTVQSLSTIKVDLELINREIS